MSRLTNLLVALLLTPMAWAEGSVDMPTLDAAQDVMVGLESEWYQTPVEEAPATLPDGCPFPSSGTADLLTLNALGCDRSAIRQFLASEEDAEVDLMAGPPSLAQMDFEIVNNYRAVRQFKGGVPMLDLMAGGRDSCARMQLVVDSTDSMVLALTSPLASCDNVEQKKTLFNAFSFSD